MATSSTRTFPLAVSGIFFRGTELFATSSVDKLDRNENIVGYTGALVRIAGANPEPVFQSKKHGLLAGTALASGDLAVGTTDGEILVLAPDGAVRRRFPSGLMPQHSPDYLVAGGVPERLFVATKAYSNAKSERAEEWDTTTWARGKSIAFTSLGVLSVSSRGVARATGKGYTNAASWGVLEYAWKGAPKAVKTPTQRSSWCISTPAGWLVSDSKTAAFVEPSGALRWTTSEELIAGCALSDTQLALVTWKGIIVVGVADGRLTESHPLELGDEESFATPCPIAASASGTVAVASESRIFIVKRPQVTANADGSLYEIALP